MLFILLLAFASIDAAFSQSDSKDTEEERYTRLGVFGALGFNQHNASFQDVPPLETCCVEFTGGNGVGPAVGILGAVPVFADSYIMIRAGYYDMNGSMEETYQISGKSLNDIRTTSNGATANFNFESVISLLNLNLEYDYNPFAGLHLYGGTMIGVMMTGDVLAYEQLVSPRDAIYISENSNIRGEQFNYKELTENNTFQFWLGAGLGYSIPVSSIYLQPFVRYYVPLTDISQTYKADESDGDWSVSNLTLGVDAYVELKPRKELIEERKYVRDTIIVKAAGASDEVVLLDRRKELDTRETEKKIYETTTVFENYQRTLPLDYEFTASLGGDYKSHSKIIIEETETREAFPLLPYVFFDTGSSDLTQSEQELLDDEEISKFDPLNLEWDALEIHSNLLNIIGKRLSENPKANITVVGTHNTTAEENGDMELSRSRAENVAEYLKETWGIDESRIKTEARGLPSKPGNVEIAEGQAENSRVEIVSSDPSITGYLNLAKIQKTANPPTVQVLSQLSHSLDSIDYDYQLTISQQGKEIRSDKGKAKGAISDPFQWEIGDSPLPTLDEKIDVELVATDEYGVIANASDEIEIEQLTIRKKREVLNNDKIVERYSLIVFDYDSAELTPVQKVNLKYASSAITPESTVIVDGHTDNIGTPEYNLNLSNRRIEEVIKTLGLEEGKNVASIVKNPHGAQDPPYTNATPKGRSYNRTVIITILNPVKK